ncbi:MAG: hypothetical protein H6702_13610 [Myxococcales bacterium]|nr:hypothetical protein [Myxococcales bacterium]
MAAGVAVLTVPLAVAVAERLWRRPGPREPGFWALARAVGGRCHVRWGREQSPVVRLALPGEAEGRIRAVAGIAGRARIEARAYLPRTAGITLRVHRPAARPLRWRTPNLVAWDGWAPPGASVEVTDGRRLEVLLEDGRLEGALEAGLVGDGGREVLVAGQVLRLAWDGAAGETAGDAAERLGSAQVAALRELVAVLADAPAADDPGPCAACAQDLDDDPWRCPGCGRPLHRGCRELLDGCANRLCAETADAPPGPRPD